MGTGEWAREGGEIVTFRDASLKASRDRRRKRVRRQVARSLLLVCLLEIVGCASHAPIDMGSYDPSHDQRAIADYYRHRAFAMREKAAAQATAAVRYEELFGPDSDLVSGARLLARYYEQTALELDRVAEDHAAVAGTR